MEEKVEDLISKRPLINPSKTLVKLTAKALSRKGILMFLCTAVSLEHQYLYRNFQRAR